MSKKDTVTKAFMRENAVFADAFNYRIFNGKKVIQPERLREVLGCIKYSKDKEKLSSFIRNNTRMTLELNAARVIQAITNVTLDLSEETEEVDMCKALDDMMQDSRAEGLAEGMEKGNAEGILFTLTSLVRDGILSVKDAAFRANMTESAFEAVMKKNQTQA